ncbi:MAG: ABC transporter ATP-binding protein [Saprospiraceae bacterium]|jgi:putative ABC transport system ATP-binding protein
MSKPVFKIRNLYCGYKENKPILLIRNLNIERSKLYFIIGPSGIGKSTFIEAVGLMNNTILSKASELLTYSNNVGEDFELLHIWNNGKAGIENFRKHYFSFLFQNNFLMPNFTSGENIKFTALFKSENVQNIGDDIQDLMLKVDLDSSFYDREVAQLSGGQKQRIAFIRSLIAPFEVLFADEPTGNLDPITARKMMHLLASEIKQNGQTVIIVSHDINLAMDFADVIVPIKIFIENNQSLGCIDEEFVVRKSNDSWQLSSGLQITDIENYLTDVFKVN